MIQCPMDILQQTFCAYRLSKKAKTICVSTNKLQRIEIALFEFHLWEYFVCWEGPNLSYVFSLTVNSGVWTENKSH